MVRLVPAVVRALDILELFARQGTLSAPEIAVHLGLPRTTVFEIVNTLTERGYLLAVGDGHRFELGPSTVPLGQRYLEGVDLSRYGDAVSRSVSERCQETVHVAIRDQDHVIYVAKADSPHPVRMVSAVGNRLPAHCTAVGKVLLAGLTSAQFDQIYPPGASLAKMTGRSIGTTAELREVIDAVRGAGLALEYCESNSDVACVAAPVFDASGGVAAGLSISVPTIRWDDRTKDMLSGIVQDGAAELTRLLGGTRTDSPVF